jgi:DNA-binding IclR family transcriptional regulator
MDAMRELRDECRETVQIGRRFGDEGVILEQVEGLHPLRISVDARRKGRRIGLVRQSFHM